MTAFSLQSDFGIVEAGATVADAATDRVYSEITEDTSVLVIDEIAYVPADTAARTNSKSCGVYFPQPRRQICDRCMKWVQQQEIPFIKTPAWDQQAWAMKQCRIAHPSPA